MVLKRLFIFLFAALLGGAALHPANAQEDEDTHQVTIEVEEIAELEIDGDVTLTFDAANGLDGVDQTAGWPDEDKIFASDGAVGGNNDAETSYNIATNLEGAQIDVQTIDNPDIASEDLEELELKVRSEERDGALERETAFHALTKFESSDLDDGVTIIDTVNPADEDGVELDYDGVVTEDFSPDDGGSIDITYTITAD